MKPTLRGIELKMVGLETTLRLRQRAMDVPGTGEGLTEQLLALVFDPTLPDAAVAEQVRALGGRQNAHTIARIWELLAIAQERQWRQRAA